MPTIVETVAHVLKIPRVRIALKEEDGFKTVAAYGTPVGEPAMLPLVHGNIEVGRLLLSPGSSGKAFSPADRPLLEDLARQVEVAVQAVGSQRTCSDLANA